MPRTPKPSQPPPLVRSGARIRAPFVLVVDDIPDHRDMYIEYLRFAGFRVLGAEDGESAIEAARTHRPSVILMDLSLPGIDGWEATRILKAGADTRDIHIIAVTAHADPASRARAMGVGCDLVVTKPALPEEIANYIVSVLDGRADKASSKR